MEKALFNLKKEKISNILTAMGKSQPHVSSPTNQEHLKTIHNHASKNMHDQAYESIVLALENNPYCIASRLAVCVLELGLLFRFKTKGEHDKRFDFHLGRDQFFPTPTPSTYPSEINHNTKRMSIIEQSNKLNEILDMLEANETQATPLPPEILPYHDTILSARDFITCGEIDLCYEFTIGLLEDQSFPILSKFAIMLLEVGLEMGYKTCREEDDIYNFSK